ncbi:MAG: MerR family transcriptional regulator [Acidobacteria bacterium]|nr:MerR family transcriptional regulator [Acidobacteriota bacterium]
MFTIGQFSRITGLSVKTIRLYHEKGLLTPKWIDDSSGYRYYDNHNIERARTIACLRTLDFPLSDIREMLDRFQEDSDALTFFEKQREVIRSRMKQLDRIATSLEEIINREREAIAMMEEDTGDVAEKEVRALQVAGLRWKGRYSDTGKVLEQVGKLAGRYIRGKPMNLYYDSEYKDEDADIESCFPVSGIKGPGVLSLHTLPAGRCVYVVHKGPYEQIGRSYERLMRYIQQKHYQALPPSREIYLKGPGMIFRGNPRKYLTEIQILIENPKENRNEKSSA